MNKTAHRVLKFRTSKSWTQQHLAEASGLSIRTIQRLEGGSSASSDTILSIAAAFDVDVSELVEIQELMDDLSDVKSRIRKGIFIHLSLWALFTTYLVINNPIIISYNGGDHFNEVFYNSIGWACGIILHISIAWGLFYFNRSKE